MGLFVFDERGHTRVYVGITECGPMIALLDRKQQLRAVIEVAEDVEAQDMFVADGASFSLADRDGTLRVVASVCPSKAALFVNDRDENIVWCAGDPTTGPKGEV